jgi:carbamoyltransferase
MIVLGLTGGFHMGSCDAAATVVADGVTVASVEEERLTRNKNSFSVPPALCIKTALEVARIGIRDVDRVVLYVDSYGDAEREMRDHFVDLFGSCPPIEMVNHHLCHAASAYYASGWDQATVVAFDWSGDGVSSSIWHGKGDDLTPVEIIERPNSLGIFYAALTQYLGFERGDEYKVMGLASYGQPDIALDHLLDVSGEVYALNLDFFNHRNRSMRQRVYNARLETLLPGLARPRHARIEPRHINLAASVQRQFERAVFNFIARAVRKTGCRRVCIAGGGGLNCTANGKIIGRGLADAVYVPPFPNDTGCSFGGAAVVAARNGDKVRPLATSQLGPAWTDEEIGKDLDLLNCRARREPDIAGVVAERIAGGKLVGWFQGGLEVGPRALGGRSILADARDASVRRRINACVKFREDFRPFAPSVLSHAAPRYFAYEHPSPYMSFIAPVKAPQELPGITHVDGTARLHTVADDGSPYARLLHALDAAIGCPVVLNTSFNYMGQPIVCTPREAIYTFHGTGLHTPAIGNWVIDK